MAQALVYASVFIGVVLIVLPARLLSWSGVARPTVLGVPQFAGIVVTVARLVLAAWCVLVFALVGNGTPAPLDPPPRLVVAGPYRFVRNPMYIDGGLALAGAAILYQSTPLLGYAGHFPSPPICLSSGTRNRPCGRRLERATRTYCQRIRWWRPNAGVQPP